MDTLSGLWGFPSPVFVVVPWDTLIVPHFGVLVKGFRKLFFVRTVTWQLGCGLEVSLLTVCIIAKV